MDELDFTIELNSKLDDETEAVLFDEADRRLHKLAFGHDDLIGAAINIRIPVKGETPSLYETTVTAYIRSENMAAIKKADSPEAALKSALDALERQVRDKREQLRDRWR
jgi:ribosome-associated translation inhibitor RaiA